MLLSGKDNGRRASLAGSTRIADLINTASVCELLYKIDPHALDPQAIVLPCGRAKRYENDKCGRKSF